MCRSSCRQCANDVESENGEGVKRTWNTAAVGIGEDMPRKALDAIVVTYVIGKGQGSAILPLLPPPRKRETPGRAVGDGVCRLDMLISLPYKALLYTAGY